MPTFDQMMLWASSPSPSMLKKHLARSPDLIDSESPMHGLVLTFAKLVDEQLEKDMIEANKILNEPENEEEKLKAFYYSRYEEVI